MWICFFLFVLNLVLFISMRKLWKAGNLNYCVVIGVPYLSLVSLLLLNYSDLFCTTYITKNKREREKEKKKKVYIHSCRNICRSVKYVLTVLF